MGSAHASLARAAKMMTEPSVPAMSIRALDALDRHALVIAIWLPLVVGSRAVFHYGFGAGGWPFIMQVLWSCLRLSSATSLSISTLGRDLRRSEVALGLGHLLRKRAWLRACHVAVHPLPKAYAVPVTLGLLGMASAI